MNKAVALLKNNKVDHYNQKQKYIQPIELILLANFNFTQGNLVKYISRCDKKGKHLDLDKALDYLYWSYQIVEKKQDDPIYIKIMKLSYELFEIDEYYSSDFFENFLNQHDDQLKELITFAIETEKLCWVNMIQNDLINLVYEKFNEVSKKRFNESLTNNLFYQKYMEIKNV